jgi:hypothetical protein
MSSWLKKELNLLLANSSLSESERIKEFTLFLFFEKYFSD